MFQVRLLGQFDVRADGKRIVIPSRAGQSLFAYLLLTAGTIHRRERLAGLFWPDTSDENARKNLRQELWRIRKAISAQQTTGGDYLLAEEFTLTFNRDAEYWLDVAQLEKPDLDLQSLISNLSLYQGELLPGFYDDWIVLERERIQGVFEAKMEQLLEQLVAAERWTVVQEWGERWLALSDTPEPAYRALMLAYGARGDIAKVASIYQRCTDELRDQLGVEPSAETRALYDGLLKGAKAPLRTTAVQFSGTVTFLFTDIEGSTQLLDRLGEQYATALAEHHQILRAAVQRWNGREVETQGDAFFVTFARALDAVQCAAEAQRALAAHVWPHGERVSVRMGMHTGEPLIASTGYVGMDVHRAARIGDAGHGGQVLLSQTTRELVMHDLPPGVTLRDLGEHRLKDMKYPTPICQLVIEGLQPDFPPLKTKFTGTEAPTPGEPPFKGLQYFDEADSDLFFGRELLTARLVNRLREAQFLSVIIGASGSGKSSLVRAGLIPALKRGDALLDGTKPPEGSADWQVHVITPTAHPLEALATELTRDSESVTATTTLMDDLAQDPRSLALFLARKNPKRHTLLVVDQFEELFTLCRDEFEREAFIDNLLNATPSNGKASQDGITTIITLRADFYAHLAHYPELRGAVAQQQEYIGPMTTEELRRAIEEPAKRGHWEFEPGLVDLILRDVGDEPGALPLLSHALLETWKRRAGHRLTLKGYADAGGVRGAIAYTAETVYQQLSSEQQIIARNIFLRLTELGEGTEDTRRRATISELIPKSEQTDQVRAVLNTLADARLVTTGEDTVEVAHEALIREWPRLRDWLTQDREGLRLHRSLTEAAHEWELLERDAGALHRGARLAQANEFAQANPNALNEPERAFLDASVENEKREEREREEARQRELEAAQKLAESESQRAGEQAHAARQLSKRARYLTGAFIVALVMAVAALFFGAQARQTAVTAQNERRLATARELAAAALNNLAIDPERSILLALQAVSTTRSVDGTVLPEAEEALHRSIVASPIRMNLTGHGTRVLSAAFSPDGKHLATIGDDGTTIIWDATSGEELLRLPGTTQPSDFVSAQRIAYSRDGQLLAACDSRQVKIYDPATGILILSLVGHQADVSAVAFSRDGTYIASGSIDGTILVWDVKSGDSLLELAGHTDAIEALTFNPDGKWLVTASDDATMRIWDAATGDLLRDYSDFTGLVDGVTFSPDGTRFAFTTVDGLHVWQLDFNTVEGATTITSQEIFTIPEGGSVFSPDGTQLAGVSASDIGNAVKLWDSATGRELLTLSGHTGWVMGIAFSPDGNRLASTSLDGTVKIWSLTPGQETVTVSGPGAGYGTRVAYNPNGQEFATNGGDGTATLWNAETGEPRLTLAGHDLEVLNVAFSSDGTRLATGSLDATAIVWDTATGQKLLTIPGHEFGVRDLAFSPDGSLIATGGFDGTARVWDTATGTLIYQITDHDGLVLGVSFSPDGTHLATSSTDTTAKIRDAKTGEWLLALTGHSAGLPDIAYSPDGMKLATGSGDGTAIIWDAATGSLLFTLRGHSSGIQSVAFNSNGTWLATGSEDNTAKVWDVATGEELRTLPGSGGGVKGVAFSPSDDGAHLAVASNDGVVRVFLLRIEDLLTLAQSRVTRALTTEECQKYLHTKACPAGPR